jgi:hypothetical protein
MARGPDGTLREPAAAEPALDGDEAAFAAALERIVDRALERHPAGSRFVYGIHQELTPATGRLLAERYRSAGWRDVTLRPGATGAYLLVLTP